MLIKCTIPRRDNSPVIGPDGKTLYHFKPDASGNHVCEVKDKDHIKGFLAHTGVYVPAGKEAGVVDAPPDLAAMERDELAALVEKATGHKPHHKLGNAKLIEIILSEEQDCKANEG